MSIGFRSQKIQKKAFLTAILLFAAIFMGHSQIELLTKNADSLVVERNDVKPVNVIKPRGARRIQRSIFVNGLVERSEKKPPISLWDNYNKIGLSLNEVAFVNWNAGGVTSISGLAIVDLKRTYKDAKTRWKNEFLAKYGVNYQDELQWQKTDDNVEYNSTFGFRRDTTSNWYNSVKFTFNTQFSNGYEYPDTSNRISTFMSPAYLFIGIGTEYGNNNENLSIYLSPVTMKSTIVMDQDLANAGAFGVEPAVLDENGNIVKEGEHLLTQMGILITNEYKAEIAKNVTLSNKLSVYTDYLQDFGYVDVNWEVLFNFKVNNFIQANLGSHLIYDNDIKLTETNADGETVVLGARTQWKQQLGIGVVVEF